MGDVTEITRREEFDAGHRVPSHGGKCRNAHGHRYAIEVTVRGPIKAVCGDVDDGMVTDFGCLKEMIQNAILDPWDHGFFVYDRDPPMLTALQRLQDGDRKVHKTIVVPFIPTAENLAREAFQRLELALQALSGVALELVNVRIFETPKSSATFRRDA